MENIYSKSETQSDLRANGRILNEQALIRRTNKMIDDWNVYPQIPAGDLTFGFISKVEQFNPLYSLDNLRTSILDMLMEQTDYKYDYEEFDEIMASTFGLREENLKIKIADNLVKEYKEKVGTIRMIYDSEMDLRPDETTVFYYAYSIYKISAELKNDDGLFFARLALKALDNFYCKKNQMPYFGIKKSGMLLNLSQYNEDRQLYLHILNLIESAICKNGEKSSAILNQVKEKENSKKRKNNLKNAKNTTLNVFIRIFMVVAVLISFKIYMGVINFDFDSWIIDLSKILLLFSATIFNIKNRNLVKVIIFDIVMAALFYPLCWLVTYLALFAIIFVVLMVVGFFKLTND